LTNLVMIGQFSSEVMDDTESYDDIGTLPNMGTVVPSSALI